MHRGRIISLLFTALLTTLAAVACHAAEEEPAVSAEQSAETVHIESADRKLEEIAAASEEFLAITDGAALAAEEMPAYWRLMRWSRDESYGSLAKQAQANVLYTQLRQNPTAYRGKVVKLRLQLRRSLRHDAPPNHAGVVQVYEAWGCTAESQPYPYLIVMSEPPPNFPLGATIDADVEFAGYFLKSMGYEANAKKLAAPLLIGRAAWPKAAPPDALQGMKDVEWLFGVLVAGAVFLVFLLFRFYLRGKSPRREYGTPTADGRRSLPDKIDFP